MKRNKALLIGLIILGLLQIGDVLTTLKAVELFGVGVEANPAARFFLERGWVVEMKIVFFGIAGTGFWLVRSGGTSLKCVKVLILLYTIIVANNLIGLWKAGTL